MFASAAWKWRCQKAHLPRGTAELEEQLVEAKKNFEDQAVVVRGEGEGLYQPVIDVLGVCHRSQVTRISLAYKFDREGG